MIWFLCIVIVLILCKLFDTIQEFNYYKKHGKELDRTINDGEGDYGF
jgi:hypothetical protein